MVTNDIDYGRHPDSGYMRYADADAAAALLAVNGGCSDSELELPSDDSDSSTVRRKGGSKPSRSRGPKVRTLNRWTPEEHERLAFLVSKWGSEKNWAKVAEEMPGRTGKQCRERWLNHMKPGIIKGNWSLEEEFLLAQCHAVVGSHWSKMTKRLPGRTENSIKNFWNATLRSKAPHKKRGILWLYMQSQTSQEGENSEAFVESVNKLYETQELPAYWAQLIGGGRLTDRTLRLILKAEKEFLEGPEAELHPLAMPHPVHGLVGAAEALTTSAPRQQSQQQPKRQRGADSRRQAGAAAAAATAAAAAQDQRAPGGVASTLTTADALAVAAAATAVAGDYAMAPPHSPRMGGPGIMTPRVPGGDTHAGAHIEGAAAGGVGFTLPPEMLTALAPCELWQSLPSTHGGKAGPFSGGGAMEPLLPGLGMSGDAAAAGAAAAAGTYGSNRSTLLTPRGGDPLWACLPSLRGLGTFNAAAAVAAADPLRMLEPFGALAGFMSARAQQEMLQRCDNGEAGPGSSAHDPRSNAGGDGAAAYGASHGLQLLPPLSMFTGVAPAWQQPQQQGGSLAPDASLQYEAPMTAGGYGSPTNADVVVSRAPAAASAAAAAAAQQAWQQHHFHAQQQEQHHASPGSDGMSDLSYAAAQAAGEQHRPNAANLQQSPSVQLSSHSNMGHWEAAGDAAAAVHFPHGPSKLQRQSQPASCSDGAGSDGAATCQPRVLQQLRQQLAHAGSDGCLAMMHRAGLQQHEYPLLAANSAPADYLQSLVQQQQGGTSSPFAPHANTAWDAAAKAPTGGSSAPVQCSLPAAGMSAAGVEQLMGPLARYQQQQQQHSSSSSPQDASLAASHAAAPAAQDGMEHLPSAAAGEDDAMAATLSNILHSAAAHAGMTAEEFCAMFTAVPGRAAPQQQQQQDDGLGSGRNGSSGHALKLAPLNLSSNALDSAHGLLEALASARHSHLAEALFSPMGLTSAGALMGAATATGPQPAGLKRRHSSLGLGADGDLLIEQPSTKQPRCASPSPADGTFLGC